MVRNFRNGDIATSGRQFAEGREEVGRNVYYRLRLFLGEYFLDITDGTPWFQSVLGKTPQDIAEATLKERIATTPGVAAISAFRFRSDRRNRQLNVTTTVLTRNGEEAEVALNEDLI